jgi:hypothetical protein
MLSELFQLKTSQSPPSWHPILLIQYIQYRKKRVSLSYEAAIFFFLYCQRFPVVTYLMRWRIDRSLVQSFVFVLVVTQTDTQVRSIGLCLYPGGLLQQWSKTAEQFSTVVVALLGERQEGGGGWRVTFGPKTAWPL